MALSHLALDVDRYEIYLDNSSNEDQLKNDEESTASQWNTIFNSGLDLSPLLYLKSTSAELALNQFSVDDLPLTTTAREKITVQIHLPEHLATANLFYGSESLSKSNDEIHEIPTVDLTTTENEVLIDHLNDLTNITFLFLRTCINFVLDTNIFKEDVPNNAKVLPADAKLIIRYLDCILFARHILHRYLIRILGVTDNSLDTVVTFSDTTNITASTEKRTIDNSTIFRATEDRPAPTQGLQPMNLDQFQGVNLSDAYNDEAGPKLKIETDTAQYLRRTTVLERVDPADENSPLTEESKQDLRTYIVSNKALVNQALALRTVISFMYAKTSGKVSPLFNDRLIALMLNRNNSRLNVILKPSLFMPPDSTSLTMTFPEHLSYVLGCKDKTQLTIGPISHGDDRENTGANGVSFAHNITISGQSPPSTIRTIPRILYVCTDIISAVSRNLWLRDTPYESCHIIYTHVIDDSNITTKFVCKTSDTLTFHRISSLQCLWNSFNVYILDQNFRKVVFPLRTYVKLGLVIKPTNADN